MDVQLQHCQTAPITKHNTRPTPGFCLPTAATAHPEKMSLLDSIPAGLLPKWMLFVSAVSLFNSAQTYFGQLSLTQRIYSARPELVTPLSNRTFGTWTAMVSIVRFYAAYHLDDPTIYAIAQSTYYVAAFHFFSEWLVFRTAKLGAGLWGPLIVASVSIVWMALQRDYYVN